MYCTSYITHCIRLHRSRHDVMNVANVQGRSLRGGGGKGGNCPPWDFQFLWFFKLIIPKSNTEIATWYLLRRHCPPAYLGQATALMYSSCDSFIALEVLSLNSSTVSTMERPSLTLPDSSLTDRIIQSMKQASYGGNPQIICQGVEVKIQADSC